MTRDANHPEAGSMTFTRRTLLGTSAGGLAAGATLASPALAQAPRRRPAIVLVHGAWHGGWCWARVVERLTESGHHVVAPDLPGHGVETAFPDGYFDLPQDAAKLAAAPSPLASLTLDAYRARVQRLVERLGSATGAPVVLVGHSLGGVTLNAVAEAAPEAVHRLVYLTALMPVAKEAAGAYFADPAMATSKALPLFIGDPAKTGAIRFNHRSPDPAFKAAAKAAFYADVSDAQFAAVANLLTPDEPAAVFGANAKVTAGRWGRVNRTYIRCTEDQAIPIAAQDHFIAEADALVPGRRMLVRTLRASHSPFISMPEELTGLLVEAAQ